MTRNYGEATYFVVPLEVPATGEIHPRGAAAALPGTGFGLGLGLGLGLGPTVLPL